MSESPQPPLSAESEAFLSAAYKRILRIAVALSVAAAALAGALRGLGDGIALAAGALLAFLNFVWLHHGTNLTIECMLASGEKRPSQQRVMFAFVGRYIFVLALAYVILRGYPQVRVAFIVGLVLPIVAAICEGVYEAIATRNG